MNNLLRSTTHIILLGTALIVCSSLSAEAVITPAISSAKTIKKTVKPISDPGAAYLEAYQLSQAADKLIKKKDYKSALKALNHADLILSQIAQEYPTWQRNIVSYRRELNAQKQTKLKAKIKTSSLAIDSTKKTDFLDGQIIRPETTENRQASQSSARRAVLGKSAREEALEQQVASLMADLDKERRRTQQAETSLKSYSDLSVKDKSKIAELQAQLKDLRTNKDTVEEAELQRKIAEEKSKGAEFNVEKLEQRLAQVQQALSAGRTKKEESLMRELATMQKTLDQRTAKEKKLEHEIKALKSGLVAEKSRREVELERRLNETLGQLSAAHQKIAELEQGVLAVGQSSQAYRQLERDYQRSQLELKAVTSALKDSKSKYEQALSRAVSAEAGEEVYRKQLTALRQQVKAEQSTGNKVVSGLNQQILKLQQRLEIATTQKNQAQSEADQLKNRCIETESQLADVTGERNSLQSECQRLQDLVKLNNPGTTKKMMEENLLLARQLKESQDTVLKLQTEGRVQEMQYQVAQTELARTKQKMIEMRDENTGYRKRISELSEKLRSAETELEKAMSQPKADPKLVEENSLLRETITKQLRILASRERSRELMIAAYKRLELQDPQMSEAIRLMDEESSYELTDTEKHLISKDEAEKVKNPDAVMVAPGLSTPEQQAEAYAKLELEVEALGSGAEDAYNKGRLGAAEQLYQTLLDRHPGHFPAHVNMGVILLKQGKTEEAAKVLQDAVDLNPDHPTGQFLLGLALYRLGKDAASNMALQAAIEADPANAKAYFYLGNLASSAGKVDLAIRYYEKSLEIDPSLVDVYYNMASTYLNGGKIQEAKKAYDNAIKAGALPDPDLENRLRNQ